MTLRSRHSHHPATTTLSATRCGLQALPVHTVQWADPIPRGSSHIHITPHHVLFCPHMYLALFCCFVPLSSPPLLLSVLPCPRCFPPPSSAFSSRVRLRATVRGRNRPCRHRGQFSHNAKVTARVEGATALCTSVSGKEETRARGAITTRSSSNNSSNSSSSSSSSNSRTRNKGKNRSWGARKHHRETQQKGKNRENKNKNNNKKKKQLW